MMAQWSNYARKLRPQDAGHTRCQAGRIPKAVASTIREIRTAGLVSNKAITHELNQRQIPAAHGGKWHRTSVDQLLHRLERLELWSVAATIATMRVRPAFLNRTTIEGTL